MSPDHVFGSWGFFIYYWPIVGVINAIIALPTTILSRYVNKRAGLIAWLLTTLGILGFVIFPTYTSWHSNQRYWMIGTVITYLLLLILPQAITYPLTQSRPEIRPWVSAGLGIVGTILFILLGAVTGATPD